MRRSTGNSTSCNVCVYIIFTIKYKKMDKETIIKNLIAAGYTTNFTLDKDCLYCGITETTYLLISFNVDKEIGFMEDGINKKIRAVSSEEYGLKGYFVH